MSLERRFLIRGLGFGVVVLALGINMAARPVA